MTSKVEDSAPERQIPNTESSDSTAGAMASSSRSNHVPYAPSSLSSLVAASMAQPELNPALLSPPSPRSPEHQNESFELRILQQPEIAAEAGLNRIALGRLPIVPAPVVQVLAKDSHGQAIDQEFPYLFCSCSLRKEDGVSAVDAVSSSALVTRSDSEAHPEETDSTEEEFSALIGNLVSSTQRVTNLEGELGNYFVFDDVSVRQRGTYTLEFRLGEMQRPTSPKLASVVSDRFEVVEWRQYPGRPAEDIVTDLSSHLANQGVPMYMPPLLNPPAFNDS